MRIGPVNRLKPYASALSTLIQKLLGQLLRYANAMPPHAQASAHTTARAMPALQRTVQFCAAAAGPAININTARRRLFACTRPRSARPAPEIASIRIAPARLWPAPVQAEACRRAKAAA